MKVEIDFEQVFETGDYIPISLGRLLIGGHIGRLVFTAEGNTRLFINETAVEDGSVVLLKDLAADVTFSSKKNPA